MDPIYPELVERFKRGFLEITRDENGDETWDGPGPVHAGRIAIKTSEGTKTYWGVSPTVVYTTTANKDWRDLLISRIGPAVEAGVDMIYLDESMCPTGKFYLDGMNGIQGIMALERGILDTYTNVVLQTEQINPLNARWSSFALTTLNLGHPLGGYIFHRFVKMVPEGFYYQATTEKAMDQFQSYGFMYPGASTEPSWLEIAEAFQTFDLEPASRLPTHENQLFGYRGLQGVTAYYEKHPTRRGLVVYQPNQEPVWYGSRITGITTWSKEGVLREWIPGVDVFSDWLCYDSQTMIALDPKKSYLVDREETLDEDRFHITRIPENFSLHANENWYIYPQYIGPDDSFFKITFAGRGNLDLHVPDNVIVFLNGEPVKVDRKTQSTRVPVDATEESPGILLAFEKREVLLSGPWVDLPWQIAKQKRKFIHQQGKGFSCHLGGAAQIVGRLPEAQSIHLQGGWNMTGRPHKTGEAVVRLNGKEALRLLPGEAPYPVQEFDVDISELTGQHVLLEFALEEHVSGPSHSHWSNPRFVINDGQTD